MNNLVFIIFSMIFFITYKVLKKYKRTKTLSIGVVVLLLTFFSGCTSNYISVENSNHTNSSKSSESEIKQNDTNSKLSENIKVHFIDVGQADSILIEEDGRFMLIDAGNNEDSEQIISYLKDQGVETLDYVIGTHPHEDHIGGLDAVIESFNIEEIFMPKKSSNTRTFEDVIKALNNKGLKITTPKPGNSFKLGKAICTILAPNNLEYDETNDYSIVIRLVYGNNSFLFTGDQEIASEKEILEKTYEIEADVLKVGHHGSSSSTSEEYLDKINPKFAVVSLGMNNKYGHPHKETLERLHNRGIKILRTDIHGTVVFTSDGNSINFNTEKGELVSGINNANTNNTSDKVSSTKPENLQEEAKDAIRITNIDYSEEVCIIENFSNNHIDMTGWTLVSVEGNQVYNFPEGYLLKSKEMIKITAGKKAVEDGAKTLKWTDQYIWNNKGDEGRLYNKENQLISSYK